MAARVLITEENHVARAFLARVVRESFSDSILVTEAVDLEDAQRQVEQAGREQAAVSRPDAFRLILLDLELPDEGALALLERLRSYPATKVVTTLANDDEQLFPALRCGADGYLLKEDRFEVVVEELQKIVRGQPPLSPPLARRLLEHFRAEAGDEASSDGAARSAQAPLPRLTPRENDVLAFLSRGFTIREIEKRLDMTWFAVGEHIRSIYRKATLRRSSPEVGALLSQARGRQQRSSGATGE